MAQLIQREENFGVCGEAGSAAEALDGLTAKRPDLVIMDMTIPDRNGLELVKDLQAVCRNLPVIILSIHDEMLYAERVIRAGGRGYLMKESAPKQLMTGVRKVLDGGIILSERASAHILGSLSGRRGDGGRIRLESLTDREIEVFELVGLGKNALEIGDQLNISSRTDDAHRAHIRDKLGLPDTSSPMRYAVRWVGTGETGNGEATDSKQQEE